jgi:glutathione S-transferase
MLLLAIGNKNYSSWSLRPWLALKHLNLPFKEVRIPLDRPETKAEILKVNPAGKVPCLVDDTNTVWDSLAILEYLAEKHPKLWPAVPAERARARSVSAEMHSGFASLRTHMPMNVRNRYPGKGRTTEVLLDIERIVALWSDCLQKSKKPFLFGDFTAADAMYAPVVFRFRTYAVDLPPACRAYSDAVLALPAMREWISAAEAEAEAMPQYDKMYG